MNVNLVGIDLAKSVFPVCAVNQVGKVVSNRQVKRDRLMDELRKYPGVTIAMEACYSAHHWGRVFEKVGHQVLLIPPQHVKPFVRVHKSDAGDALAICEAAKRPKMHFVPVKSIEQQDLQVLQRVRERYIHQRTALAEKRNEDTHNSSSKTSATSGRQLWMSCSPTESRTIRPAQRTKDTHDNGQRGHQQLLAQDVCN